MGIKRPPVVVEEIIPSPTYEAVETFIKNMHLLTPEDRSRMIKILEIVVSGSTSYYKEGVLPIETDWKSKGGEKQ